MKRLTFLCVIGLLFASLAGAANLDLKALGIPDLRHASIAWAPDDTAGTYTGKSMLAVAGLNASGELKTYVYWIEPNVISGEPAIVKTDETSIPGLIFGSMDWADYDMDGRLDLAVAGRTGGVLDTAAATSTLTAIFRQTPSGFTRYFSDGTTPIVPIEVPGLDSSTVRWVDYDVDGYVDLFITGRMRTRSRHDSTGKAFVTAGSKNAMLRNTPSETGISHVFVLDTGEFTGVDQIKPIHGGGVAWGDFDRNGMPDLAITGVSLIAKQGDRFHREAYTILYFNGKEDGTPGKITRNQLIALPKRHDGDVAWGDFDKDGLLDLAICGRDVTGIDQPASDEGNIILQVYLNQEEGLFAEAKGILEQKYAISGKLGWIDFDNDGWLDLVAMGDAHTLSGTTASLRVFKNIETGGSRALDVMNLTSGTPALYEGEFAIGHLDRDGTADIIAAGTNVGTGLPETGTWVMAAVPVNAAPTVASIDQPIVAGDRVIFQWTQGEDDNSGKLLTYELLMYSGSGGDVLKLFSDRATYGRGAQGNRILFTLYRSLQPSPILPLRVRAVDAAGNTSKWTSPKNPSVELYVRSLKQLIPLELGAASWVDISGNGMPDLLLSGQDDGSNITTRLYRNIGGGDLVPDADVTLPGLHLGEHAWGDVNGDGFIDVLMTGSPSSKIRMTNLYLNQGGVFSTQSFKFDELTGSSAAMGDLDNDGDIDFIAMGISGVEYKMILGINPGQALHGGTGNFTMRVMDLRPDHPVSPRAGGELQGLLDGQITLFDYDNDGDLDLCLQGSENLDFDSDGWLDYDGYLEIYRNDGNLQFRLAAGWASKREFSYTPEVSSLPVGDMRLDQLAKGSHAFADIDNDGDADFIAVGWSTTTDEYAGTSTVPSWSTPFGWDPSTLRIYENDGGVFKMAQADTGLWFSSLVVADQDNDGFPDILLTGFDDHHPNSLLELGQPTIRFYKNDGGNKNNGDTTFVLQNFQIFNNMGSGAGDLKLADYDGDGDLDFLTLGRTAVSSDLAIPFTELLANTSAGFAAFRNNPPQSPMGLIATTGTTDTMRFSWDEAIDDNPGMVTHHTYSLRVGTKSGTHNVRPGVEQVGLGSLGYAKSTWIGGLPDGAYYWSVRAVDNGFARSRWATEQRDTIDTTPPMVTRLIGDTLGVGSDNLVNLILDLDDALTGVDTAKSNVGVTIDLVGMPGIEVTKLRWGPGDTWYGQCSIPVGRFLSEPVTVHVDSVFDRRGNLMPDTTFTTELTFRNGVVITQTDGGSISNAGGTVMIYFPPRAVTQDTRISLVDPAITTMTIGTEPKTAVASAAIIPTPDIVELATPGVLSMAVPEGATATTLRIFRLDGEVWTYLGGGPDPAGKFIKVPVTKLGTFALADATGLVDIATLADLTCTPRVFSPGTSEGLSDHTEITFTVKPEDAGDAKIMVYNRAGRLIDEFNRTVSAGGNSIAWYGLDKKSKRVHSGLYLVVVEVNETKKHKGIVVLNKY
jgi:hypothetical protein